MYNVMYGARMHACLAFSSCYIQQSRRIDEAAVPFTVTLHVHTHILRFVDLQDDKSRLIRSDTNGKTTDGREIQVIKREDKEETRKFKGDF